MDWLTSVKDIALIVGVLVALGTSVFTFRRAASGDVKEAIDTLRTEVHALRTDVRADMDALRTDVRADMNALRTDMRADMDALRTEVHADVNALRTEVRADIREVRRDLTAVGERVARIEGALFTRSPTASAAAHGDGSDPDRAHAA